jgi:hypothetical protein
VTMVEQSSPEVLAEGLGWYELAHQEVRSIARSLGITLHQAAGMYAVASPRIDASIITGEIERVLCGRTSQIVGRQRRKIERCLHHHPTTVLDPRTGPKTWAFYWNVYAPSLRDHVTVDGRHADIIANSMRPWRQKRGIDNGGPGTRYESYEYVTEDAARELRKSAAYRGITAVQVQAITWCEGKRIERQGVTLKGLPRRQSPARKGQPYLEESCPSSSC